MPEWAAYKTRLFGSQRSLGEYDGRYAAAGRELTVFSRCSTIMRQVSHRPVIEMLPCTGLLEDTVFPHMLFPAFAGSHTQKN